MIHNLAQATVPAGRVFPKSLSTSFTMTRLYPVLSVQYNDGTFERSLITDTVNPARALRTWVIAKRLTHAQLTTLLNFWELTALGGQNPFYYYDPTDVLPGHHHGSNWDATGGNPQGRAIVFFRGDWAHTVGLGRCVVPGITLVEVL